MDPYRLKIKIGNHEFEAEGDATTVQMQLEIFKDLVKTAAQEPPPQPPAPAIPSGSQVFPPSVVQPPSDYEAVDAKLSAIMKVKERFVSLTVRAKSVDDAALLVIYGQKIFRNNDAITGNEIAEGLKESGQLDGRTDRILDRLAKNGNIIVTGEYRSRKYRINNQGLRNARQLAADLITTVA